MSTDYPPGFELASNTLRISGEIAFDEQSAFEKALVQLVETGQPPLLVDLSRVTFMNSSCVRLIAMAMVRANQRGRKITVRAGEKVRRLLGFAGIDKLGPIEPSEET